MKRNSRTVKIGNIAIGGENPIAIQSMLSVPSWNIEGSIKQAKALEEAGCKIIRAAVPDIEAVKLIYALKLAVSVPIVADIHFDYRLALECAAAGVDKIRINPGNIGGEDRVKAVAKACTEKNIPIRIGVNSGSVEKELLKKLSVDNFDPIRIIEKTEGRMANDNQYIKIVYKKKVLS